MPASTARATHLRALAVHVALALVVLFESLFLDATLLGIDTRVHAPFAGHLAEDAAPRPMNLTSLDATAWLIPERLTRIERVRAGELPLWNPGESLGQPLMATLGDAPFYPAALLDYGLPTLRSYALSMALHLVLLGFGTWLVLIRRGRRSPPAALLGSVVVMLCAYVTAHLQAPLFVRTIAWLPWLHLCVERLIEHPGSRRAGVLAAAVGASLLAGFPQIAMLSLYAALIVGAPLWIGVLRTSRARAWQALRLAPVAIAAGGAIACIQLVPAVELLGESWRANGWSSEVMEAKSLSAPSLVGLALPHAFGPAVQTIDPVRPAPRDVWSFPSYRAWQTEEVQNNFEENALYAGLIPLVLALFGLFASGARGPGAGWLAVIVLALGVPLVADLAGLLPGFRSGSPKRVLFLSAYALAWLASLEVDRVIARRGSARSWFAGAAALLVLGGLGLFPFQRWLFDDGGDAAWYREVVSVDLRVAASAGLALALAATLASAGRGRSAALVLIVATSTELVHFARHTNPAQELRDPYAATPGIEWLQENARDARIVSFRDAEVLPASIAQLYGLRSCNAMASLLPRRSGELLRAIEPESIQLDNPCFAGPLQDASSLSSPVLDLLGARFVTTGVGGYVELGDSPDVEGLELVYASEKERFGIYERAGALPPAFIARRTIVVPDAPSRLERLASPGFRPDEVLVEEPLVLPNGASWAGGRVAYDRLEAGRIELEAETEGPAFVLVSETWFPGWRASVDGEPVELHRANHALMGIVLPSGGSHRVELVYRPASFRVGAALSALGLLATLFLLLNRPRPA